MKQYAVADEVPEECDYLTAGKEYEIYSIVNEYFSFIDDKGLKRVSMTDRPSPWHLNGKAWRIVERAS